MRVSVGLVVVGLLLFLSGVFLVGGVPWLLMVVGVGLVAGGLLTDSGSE